MRLFLLVLLLAPVAARAQPSAATEAAFFDALTRAFLDDHAGAVARYRDLLADAPGQPAVLGALADSYAALGELSLAQDAADEAARLAPDVPSYPAAAARIAVLRGDLAGADARYRALLDRHPEHAEGVLGRAALLERQGALGDALALLETLPPSPDVLDRRLALYDRTGDAEAFGATLARRLTYGPVDGALLRRARALREAPAARPAEAPAPSPAHAAYASGDFGEAVRLFKLALDRDAGDAGRWAALAMATLEAGRPGEARTVLEDGALIFFDAPVLRVPAAYAALLAGEADAAEAFVTAPPDGEPVLVQAALLLAAAAVRHARGDAAGATRLRAAAFEQAPLDALRAAALAPAGGALQKLLP